MLSLLEELDLKKDIILQKYEVLSYLKIKVFEIEQIYHIRNTDLREEFLKKNVNKDLLELEINDIEYDIDSLYNHFIKYIEYNVTDSLFKCTHPTVDMNTGWKCYLCKTDFLIKEDQFIYKISERQPKEFTEKEFQLSDKILRFIKTNNIDIYEKMFKSA